MSREQISALMDGELGEARVQALCSQMKSSENWECWTSYHVIGDALRDECIAQSGFSRRFAERLAAEPTVLAPGQRSLSDAVIPISTGWRSTWRGRRVQYAMAATAMLAAVGVVGWFGVQEFTLGPGLNQLASAPPSSPSSPSLASLKMGTTVAATSVQASRKAGGFGISPYLLVHQEYSPTTAMQGVRPYVRTVADITVE